MDALVWLGTVTAGAIVGIVIRESFAWGRDKWVERKNSIRGTYETSTTGSAFRGPPDQATETIHRELVLRQRGRGLRGVEIGKDESEVRWELRGEVNGEFIVGTYRQTSPPSVIDKGAFHLERDSHEPRRYRGLWVGWHPERRQLTSGEYEWMRENE